MIFELQRCNFTWIGVIVEVLVLPIDCKCHKGIAFLLLTVFVLSIRYTMWGFIGAKYLLHK